MKGKNKFTQQEIACIRECLEQLREVGRDAQMHIRKVLRGDWEFNIEDFKEYSSPGGFTAEDLDTCIALGVIKVPEDKRTRGQRGPDKKPRNHGGGMPVKPELEKAAGYRASLYPHEKEQAIQKFGSLGNAVRWAIENYPKI